VTDLNIPVTIRDMVLRFIFSIPVKNPSSKTSYHRQ
jgi:hypothetical protein